MLWASRFVLEACGPCSVVELASAGLDVGADPGDAVRARSPVMGGQLADDRGGGLVTHLASLSPWAWGGVLTWNVAVVVDNDVAVFVVVDVARCRRHR